MKDLLKNLISLQQADTRILQKRLFIDKVPSRISEVDEPLRQANAELDRIKQKNEAMAKKKREKELLLDETNEKIQKMKSRSAEIKTNKEYQAHLKEIEAMEKGITDIEDEILLIMEDLDNSLKIQKEKETNVAAELRKIDAFKKELQEEVGKNEKELTALKAERAQLSAAIDPDIYNLYMSLLASGNGTALARAQDEICLGCNMNIPPQLFVEIRKNEDIIQCHQCRRILYYSEPPQ